MIDIKRLPSSRWQEFRNLRLEALQNDSTAFGSSYEEEIHFSQTVWEERMANILFAMAGNQPVGMMVFIINQRLKTRHIANIYGVYVKLEFRGQAVGRRLLEETLGLIEQDGQVTKIGLTVNPVQSAAVKLYERFGFKTVGRLHNEMKVDGRYYDEVIMEKYL